MVFVGDEVLRGITTGFINEHTTSNPSYQPKLLINNRIKERKVLTSLLNELKSCDEFYFSVAFVTNSGVAVLINTLKELEQRNIHGKILVSQYQNFTEPRALRRLIRLKNLEVKIMVEGNLHAKCYVFRKGDIYSLIVGSSNLTANALCSNTEWNLRVSSTNTGLIVADTLHEFTTLFESAVSVDETWIDQYESLYAAKPNRWIQEPVSLPIVPNAMQKRALEGIKKIRDEGKRKALLISATGTGKTYLSAFDVKIVNPRSFLFVVHRERIAHDALHSYQKVFGSAKTMGIFTGRKKDLRSEFIFATIQSLNNYKHLFSPDYFEYIVIDEVHHAGAKTYQDILDYFRPKFLLGMTATPERTDGYDIFRQFEYNIAYEMRLNDALEEHMLSPFHYYGVSDLLVNGEIVDDKTTFTKLTSQERVARIVEYATFYGCDIGRVKGLIFCSRVEEANVLSRLLNAYNLKTVAISGTDSDAKRKEAIDLLESSDPERYLNYLVTVDIFNEGIDIPSVNQIIMLRPTQSAIIFVQQLGRGLRISSGKRYLTVIDFIGNYENNYLIPVALFGDRSYNKDTLRKLLSSGSTLIPGSSSVNFDRVSKQKIYHAINHAQISKFKQLRDDYQLLKFKIGRIPTMMDFVEHGERDPYAYVKKEGSLYSFIVKVESNISSFLSDAQKNALEFFAKEVGEGKRIEELVILKILMKQESVSLEDIISILQKTYSVSAKCASVESAVRYINGKFQALRNPVEYIVYDGTHLTRTAYFKELLASELFVFHLNDLLDYAVHTFTANYTQETYYGGFILYGKYSRKDVCRILNWERDEHATMYGYRIKYNTCPIFITYTKRETISASIQYEDYFLSPRQLHWMTRNGVRLESREPEQIRQYKKTGLRILLFVKKSDDEGSDFYYLGDMKPIDGEFHQTVQKIGNGATKPIVNINFELDVPVDENLYTYLHETEQDETEENEMYMEEERVYLPS